MPDMLAAAPAGHAVPAAGSGLPQRRLVELPVAGPDAVRLVVRTEPQGRAGESFAPENLTDLISSIARDGLLQPVLAEEVPGADGQVTYHLVAGERRLRATLWGAAHMPGNPHFAVLPAIVCPGPLRGTQRRRWQVAENLARADLRPGELGAALMWERCALLEERLEAAGGAIPEEVTAAEDPSERYRLLADVCRDWPGVAAPWADVLDSVGIAISPRRARAVTAAFRALPRDLSHEMDRHQVTVSARLAVARLTGRDDAAAEIWRAVKARGRPELLAAAAAARAADPSLDAGTAAGRAAVVADAATAARSTRRSTRPAGQMIDPAVTESLIAGLRDLLTLLRAGGYAGEYTTGSLRLLCQEVAGQLAGPQDLQEAG